MDGLVLCYSSARIGEADAANASAGQKVMGAGTDDAGYVDCEARLVQGSRSIVLAEWDGSKDRVGER